MSDLPPPLDPIREIDALAAARLNGVSRPPRAGTVMFAVLCDDEIYLINRIEKCAAGMAAAYSHGSKRKWSSCRVRVTPIKNRKRR